MSFATSIGLFGTQELVSKPCCFNLLVCFLIVINSELLFVIPLATSSINFISGNELVVRFKSLLPIYFSCASPLSGICIILGNAYIVEFLKSPDSSVSISVSRTFFFNSFALSLVCPYLACTHSPMSFPKISRKNDKLLRVKQVVKYMWYFNEFRKISEILANFVKIHWFSCEFR